MREAGDLRTGNVIKVNNDLLVILKSQLKQGCRKASTITFKLKNLATGSISESAFRTDLKLDNAILDKSPMQYLYGSAGFYTFMDQVTFEQVDLTEEVLGDSMQYIKEQDILDVVSYEGKPITVELPAQVELTIKYTEPAVKGDTTKNVFKTAKVDTNIEIQVPLYCEDGDKIKVDTRTGEFVERVKIDKSKF